MRAANLSDYRVLAFATHGLVAGDLEGLAEPALVLTPPATATADDDGLLTASEVAMLKLDADWVILSACNTAAADGTPGADGLSGLAKAFFYAGSRALLVSHWPVVSEAAVKLTTTMLAYAADHPAAGRSEALRQSMLALMADDADPRFAHPMFWAPFVVVGEGGVAPATAGMALASTETAPETSDVAANGPTTGDESRPQGDPGRISVAAADAKAPQARTVAFAWRQTFGATTDDRLYASAPDGTRGRVFVGSVEPPGSGKTRGWFVRAGADGVLLGERTLLPDGYLVGRLSDIVALPGGDFVAAGWAQRSAALSSQDGWVARLTRGGEVVWSAFVGGADADRLAGMRRLPGGDVVVVGRTRSEGSGSWDGLVARLTADGRALWRKTYGGHAGDGLISVAATANGEMVLAGWSESESRGRDDVWILRLDGSGRVLWERRWGGTGVDIGYAVLVLPGGDIVVAGYGNPPGRGDNDGLMLRLDGDGILRQAEFVGGPLDDRFYSAEALPGGGFVLAGATMPPGTDAADGWLARYGADGKRLASEHFGGADADRVFDVKRADDGSLVLTGYTRSRGAGSYDGWAMKAALGDGEAPALASAVPAPPPGPGEAPFHSRDGRLEWSLRFADRRQHRDLYRALSEFRLRPGEVAERLGDGWRLPSRREVAALWRDLAEDQRERLLRRKIYTNGESQGVNPECIQVRAHVFRMCHVYERESTALILVRAR